LVALNVVADEFQLWREFERAWIGHSNKPPFVADFGGNAIILAAVAASIFIAGLLAVRRVYGTAGNSGWERGAWSAFVQWLCLTVRWSRWHCAWSRCSQLWSIPPLHQLTLPLMNAIVSPIVTKRCASRFSILMLNCSSSDMTTS
jgi:hypothetical protein